MFKKYSLTTLGVMAVVLAIVGTKILQFKAMAAAGAAMVMPAETVTSTTVHDAEWERSISATGSVVAVQGVTVSAEMAGKITKIAFEAGATVAAGDLLVQLDTSTEEAQLRSADAASMLGKTNLDRANELRAKNTNSQADLDAVDAQAKQAAAQADNIRSIIAKKTIRAPFAGRLGLRLVNLGQNLKEGDAIVSLQTLDPIYVNFSVPQQRIPVLKVGGPVRVVSDAAPGDVFAGKITAISPDVDVTTRNVRLQATLDNSGEKLRPGMFANVTIVMAEPEKVRAIPVSAILYAPYGDSVFVIDEKKNEKTGQTEKILRQQFVRLGTTRGDFVAVVNGLQDGEAIVTSGVFKLRPGIAVVIDNTLAPDAKLAPTPKDG
ncbi:MAG: efflux transporter, family, subunit [Verrucomicrobia bacterium]|nr:efflux transporter, family, subunit [Verrucomicrobiota bacterium]